MLILLGIVVALIAGFIIAALWPWLKTPVSYRFPLSQEAALTEPLAIAFTKKALIADGQATSGMLPMSYRPNGQAEDKRNLYFAVNSIDPNSGYVLWSTFQGGYIVHIEKEGDHVVCQVHRMK